MNIHRFTAPDMRHAIRQVRREFGPDAVILKSDRCADGVRVVCGTDFDEQQLDVAPVHARQPSREDVEAGRARRRAADPGQRPAGSATEAAPAQPAPGPATGSAPSTVESAPGDETQLSAMRRELRSLRGMLRSELAALAQNKLEQNQPLRADILRRCRAMGLESALTRRLTEGVATLRNANDAWRVTLSALLSAMPSIEYEMHTRGGRFAFYGPAGVGKTTAVVRIAAQFARRHGRQTVGLISADCRRPGAQTEMLRRGQELGVYTLAVSSAAETREAIDLLSDRRLILVDTAAMTPRDSQLAEQAALLRSMPQLRPWLVLSATTQGRALHDMVQNLAGLRPAACILTRLDECVALGEALSVTIDCGLPVACVSYGPEREDHLVEANPQRLLRHMVRGYTERRREEDSDACDDDAAVMAYAEIHRPPIGSSGGMSV